MSSDEQKNIIKTKDIHFNEQVFQQLVNGFAEAKKNQEYDMKYMKTYPSVRQQMRMRITTPYLFGDFLRSHFLQKIIKNEYDTEKTKKVTRLQENFFTSWYDLQWWSKKLNQDQQQFDAEKDKSSWFSKLFKAYRIFTKFGRMYKTFKSMYQAAKKSQGYRTLFGRGYNLYNQQDYRAFETNLNMALVDSVGVFQAGLVVWFKPTILSIRGLYLKQLQTLYDKFGWWLFRELFWGNNWIDIIFSIASYALSIAGFFMTGGTSSAIGAANIAYRIANVSLRLKRVFGIFTKTGRAIRAAKNAKRVYKYSSIGRWGRRAEAIGKRSLRQAGLMKYMRGLDRAKKIAYSKRMRLARFSMGLYIMYGRATDYQTIREGIFIRTKIMYQQLRGKLTMLQYGTEAVADIVKGMKLLSNAGKQRYIRQKYHDNRVNKKFGLQMKMSDKEVKKYPFFVTLEKLQIFFHKLLKQEIGEIKTDNIFGVNSQWKRRESMALLLHNLTGKRGDSIGWHKGGKQLLINFADKNKISIITDDNGNVQIVQNGDNVIDWKKAIANTQSKLAGRKSNVKVSGFQWKYVDDSKDGQYKRKMKIAQGAKITFSGIDFGKEQKELENDVTLLVSQNNSLDLYVNSEYILGKNFQDNFKSFTSYGRRQVEAQQELKNQCKLLLQIIKDKSTNDEGRQYDPKVTQKLVDEIMTTLETMQYYNVVQYYDTDGNLINDEENGFKRTRTKTEQKIGDKDLKAIREELQFMASRGDVKGLNKAKDSIQGRVERDKDGVAYTQHITRHVVQRINTYEESGDLSVKYEVDEDETGYQQKKLFVSEINDIIGSSMSGQGYIENGQYHSN